MEPELLGRGGLEAELEFAPELLEAVEPLARDVLGVVLAHVPELLAAAGVLAGVDGAVELLGCLYEFVCFCWRWAISRASHVEQ